MKARKTVKARPAPRPIRAPAPDAAFRTLYERSPIGIAELDDNGRFTRTNAALQRMLGRTAAELRALTFNEVTHRDDLHECETQFGRLVRRDTDHFEIEKRFLRKDGGIVWAHTVVTAMRLGNRSRGMVGMAIDITERHEAQAELARLKAELEHRIKDRTAELEYRGALLSAQKESSPDGILVVNAEGRIVSHNERFAEMWSIPADVLDSGSDERAIASVLSMLVKPDAFLARVRHLYEHPDEKGSEELALLDGRIFERYSSPVRGGDGRYYGRIWYFRDITDRVLHENELEEKTEALAQSNTELEMFAYAASHDLSAPLRRIRSFGELLEERVKGKLDAVERQYLDRMINSAAGAQKLVADMLTLSRVGREALPLEDVDLNAALEEVKTELMAELAGARIEAGRLPVLRAHSALIHSLLLNLISNALKFRKEEGPARVSVSSRRNGDDVEVAVADDGIGFDREYAEKIFLPFLRLHTSQDYKGSGIGLAICRRIAVRYGGALTADSEPGRGSTFTLRLPATMLAP